MTQKCRCLYCEATEATKPARLFIASKKKYGRDKVFWGVCSDCAADLLKILLKEMRVDVPETED